MFLFLDELWAFTRLNDVNDDDGISRSCLFINSSSFQLLLHWKASFSSLSLAMSVRAELNNGMGWDGWREEDEKVAIKSNKFVVFFHLACVLFLLQTTVFLRFIFCLSGSKAESGATTKAEREEKQEIVKHMKRRFSQVNWFSSSSLSCFLISILLGGRGRRRRSPPEPIETYRW